MSESVNPTPTNTSELSTPIEVAGGTSPVSWDELEGVSKYKAEVKKQEKKAEIEAEKAVAPKKKEAKSEPKDSEDESEESDEGEGKRAHSDKKEQESKKEVAEKVATAKKLKLKNGDQEIELATDIKVPVKIDGKLTEVTLQEALNRYSQQAHLDKIYKDYKSQSEKFETERKAISDALNSSYDYLVNKKDLRGFLDYMGEALGVDSHALYQDAVSGLSKQLEEWQGLSPEERRLKELEQENAYWKSKEDSKKAEREAAKSRQALESEVNQVMTSYSMTQSELVKAYDELKSLNYKDEDLQANLEFIGRYHDNKQKMGLIEETLKEIGEELATEESIVEWLELATANGIKKDQLPEVIQEYYQQEATKKVNSAIRRKERANRQLGSKAQKNPGSDPLFFDDLT